MSSNIADGKESFEDFYSEVKFNLYFLQQEITYL